MDNDVIDILGNDDCFRDSPMTDDLSDSANSVIANATNRLQSSMIKDDEFMKSILYDLLLVEKRCRLSFDGNSGSRICNFILQILYNNGDLANLNYYLIILTRKRGQLKRVTSEMVDLAKSWIPTINDMEKKMALIDTLSTITEGKMFLEIQRAEIVFCLARIKESQGQIPEAAKILQDIEVETFGCLTKFAKTEYILEQMRLHLLNCDYIRFYITSKKINPKLLEGDDYVQLKLRFFELMVRYHLHDEDYFEIAKACCHRLETLHKIQNPSYQQELECCIFFMLIFPINEEGLEFMHNFAKKEAKKINELPLLGPFFNEFLSDNLILWPLESQLENLIKGHLVFQSAPLPGGPKRLETLRNRIIQHNIRVVSKFYTRIKISRLAELNSSTSAVMEQEISEMVHNKSLSANIDRFTGIIKFGIKKDHNVVLDQWASGIGKLMDLVDQCSRLVQKEKMIHEARAKQCELEVSNNM